MINYDVFFYSFCRVARACSFDMALGEQSEKPLEYFSCAGSLEGPMFIH